MTRSLRRWSRAILTRALPGVVLGALVTVVRAEPVPDAPQPAFERTEQREPCADHDPLRRPFFGDLHVHTALSFDAWAQGTRNSPRDAYRFARGEEVGVQPYGPEGEPVRTVRLGRPLCWPSSIS